MTGGNTSWVEKNDWREYVLGVKNDGREYVRGDLFVIPQLSPQHLECCALGPCVTAASLF